jgi:glycosyltransferase involved in cell wall biosynthesis
MISIIIATFNCAGSIGKTIQSVNQQSCKEWELIIVDDGSTDDTYNLIKEKYLGDKIKYFYQENKGVSAARNYGASLATGEFLMFLDADDTLFPNVIENFQKLIGDDDLTGIASGAYLYSSRTEVKPRVKGSLTQYYKLNTLVGSFILNKQLFTTAGGYDENLTFSENFELFIRLTQICKEEKISVKAGDFLTFNYNHYSGNEKNMLREKKKIETYKYLYNKYKDLQSPDFDFRTRSAETVAISSFRLGNKKEAVKWQLKAIQEKPSIKSYFKLLRYLTFS